MMLRGAPARCASAFDIAVIGAAFDAYDYAVSMLRHFFITMITIVFAMPMMLLHAFLPRYDTTRAVDSALRYVYATCAAV